jgi:chromosome segregation ATPase
MINTLKIFNDLKQTMDPSAAEKIVDVIGAVYEELKNSVTKTEFNELKEIVRDLAEAQKRTEIRVEELAEAQKRTEIRLEELAEAQKRTEIRLEELAEAQKRTEIKLEKLTERVDDLTKRMDELTKNVSRLERKVEDLVGEMKRMKVNMQDMKQEIGGLSHTVGYRLEDEAMKSLPALLKRDLSIDTEGSFVRDYVQIGAKKYVEINIWGRGLQNGKAVEIIGEAKSQLKKRDVDTFLETIKTVQPIMERPIIPVFVTYQTSPDVRHYAQAKGITLYFSYQL